MRHAPCAMNDERWMSGRCRARPFSFEKVLTDQISDQCFPNRLSTFSCSGDTLDWGREKKKRKPAPLNVPLKMHTQTPEY